VIAVLSTLILLSDTASARVIQLQNHSQSDIQKACTDAKGSFYSDSKVYSCTTPKGEVACKKTDHSARATAKHVE
jgi:hypothetical protein